MFQPGLRIAIECWEAEHSIQGNRHFIDASSGLTKHSHEPTYPFRTMMPA